MRLKKQKNKKEHRLRKGYGNRLSKTEIDDLTDFLNEIEDNSGLLINDITLDEALPMLTHDRYISFMAMYGWMKNHIGRIDEDICIEMMEYLFQDITEDIVYYNIFTY